MPRAIELGPLRKEKKCKRPLEAVSVEDTLHSQTCKGTFTQTQITMANAAKRDNKAHKPFPPRQSQALCDCNQDTFSCSHRGPDSELEPGPHARELVCLSSLNLQIKMSIKCVSSFSALKFHEFKTHTLTTFQR